MPVETTNHEDPIKGKNFISNFFHQKQWIEKIVLKIIIFRIYGYVISAYGSIRKVKSHRQKATSIYLTRCLHSCRLKFSVAWIKHGK